MCLFVHRTLLLSQEEIFEVGSEGMSVGELADRLAVNGGDVLKALFMKGIMAQVNQVPATATFSPEVSACKPRPRPVVSAR